MAVAQQQHAGQQSLFTDDFLYFVLRLRKSRIRQVADRVRRMHPDESPEQQARHLIGSTAAIAFAAGGVVQMPSIVPGFGVLYEGLGFVAGTSILTRMHLYLILEIALLFGKDIDESDRVKELAAVVATCAVSAAAPVPVLAATMNPAFAVATGALAATAATRVIGEAAIRRYKRSTAPEGAVGPAPSGGGTQDG